MEKYLITSALPYANGDLHIGHLAGAYLPADIFVRYLRLKQEDVVFICGTDEHGAPISIQAEQKGITPKELVAKYHNSIASSFEGVSIEFDNFSGTSRSEHIKLAQDFFLELDKNGYIDVRNNEQFYCKKCTRYLADRYVEGTCPFCNKEGARGDQCDHCGKLIDTLNLINAKCKICQSNPIINETSHWFINLPKFEKDLREWLETKDYWKDNILRFILGILDEGLKERAITRDLKWGVPVPIKNSEGKVLYVWFEAPIGYISSTIEWAKNIGQPDKWKTYWCDDDTKLIHFIGKDNNVFHAVFWPAVLMGQKSNYILPHDIPANEFLNLEGRKISTSNNWAIWVNDFLKNFDGELLRYYLAAIAPETKDSDFSWKEFQDKNNSDLANTFGNLINRVCTFAHKYFDGVILKPDNLSNISLNILTKVKSLTEDIDYSYKTYKVRKAVKLCMDIARIGNKYFDDEKPWLTIKSNTQKTQESLYVCLNILEILSIALCPVLPQKIQLLRKFMSLDPQSVTWNDISAPNKEKYNIGQVTPLFPRIPDKIIEKEIEILYRKGDHTMQHKDIIEFEDFNKMEIRIATVINAESIPKADKLLKLTVSLGDNKRTVIAGIAKHYDPQVLVNKKVVILVNLKPRKLFGYESQGMILAAEDDEKLVLLKPETEIEEGSTVS